MAGFRGLTDFYGRAIPAQFTEKALSAEKAWIVARDEVFCPDQVWSGPSLTKPRSGDISISRIEDTPAFRESFQVKRSGSGRNPAVKSSLCASVLIAFSLLNCDLFAASGKLPLPAHSDASVGSPAADATVAVSAQFEVPGPLRSFLRMAGISQKISAEEVLPLLSRNVFTQGYEGTSRPTEFLILLRRYVVQARELSELSAASGMILRVSNCDDARPLLRILGYRARANCGEPGTSLQTEDAERAFLAIDSGFPLPDLEQTLQGGKPFEYAYSSST